MVWWETESATNWAGLHLTKASVTATTTPFRWQLLTLWDFCFGQVCNSWSVCCGVVAFNKCWYIQKPALMLSWGRFYYSKLGVLSLQWGRKDELLRAPLRMELVTRFQDGKSLGQYLLKLNTWCVTSINILIFKHGYTSMYEPSAVRIEIRGYAHQSFRLLLSAE